MMATDKKKKSENNMSYEEWARIVDSEISVRFKRKLDDEMLNNSIRNLANVINNKGKENTYEKQEVLLTSVKEILKYLTNLNNFNYFN